LELRDAPFVIADGGRFEEIQRGATVRADGVLGMNVLRSAAVRIEPDSPVVTLRFPGGLTPAEVRREGFAGAVSVPLLRRPGVYCRRVTVRLADRLTGTMMLDTGGARVVLKREWAR